MKHLKTFLLFLSVLLASFSSCCAPASAQTGQTIPTLESSPNIWTGINVYQPGDLQLTEPISPCSAGQFVPGLDASFSPLCGSPGGVVNGPVVYPAQCTQSGSIPSWCGGSGHTADAYIRAACSALPATGGYVNLNGLTGTIANQVTCSTPSKQVQIIGDNTAYNLLITESDGLTVFPIDNGSSYTGYSSNGACLNLYGLTLAPTANVAAVIGGAHPGYAGQENFSVMNTCMHGYPGATVTKGMIWASFVYTNTTIANNNVLQCPGPGDCILTENVGGSMIVTGNEFDGSEGNPVVSGGNIEISAAGVNGCGTGDIYIQNGDAEHSNAGRPEINIHGDGHGALVCWVSISNMYIEKSAVGTPNTAGISLSDCWGCSVTNVQIAGGDGVHNTGAGIQISYTGQSSWSQQNRIQNVDVGSGAYANTLIDSSLGGITLSSSLVPFIDNYTSNPGYQQLPPLPASTLQSVGGDLLSGIGNFGTGTASFGTGFGAAGCQPTQGTTCTFTRTNSTAPSGSSYSQAVQITANTGSGFEGIESTASYSFTAGQTYLATFWAKGDGTFQGAPYFYLGNFIGNTYCQNIGSQVFQSAWTLHVFSCTPTVSGSSNLSIGSLTPQNATGTFWVGGFSFTPVTPLTPGVPLAAYGPYAIGPAPGVLYNAATNPLPTCGASIKGEPLTVSDATAPTYMGAYTSGGSTTAQVICSYNGAAYAWLTH